MRPHSGKAPPVSPRHGADRPRGKLLPPSGGERTPPSRPPQSRFRDIPSPHRHPRKPPAGRELRQRRRQPRTHACPLLPCGQAAGNRRRDGRGAATRCGHTGSSFRCGFAAEPMRGQVVAARYRVPAARLFFSILILFYFKPKAKPGAARAASGLVLLRRVGLRGTTGRPSAAPPGARSRRCFGGHRAGAAGTCTAVPGRARSGRAAPFPQRAAGEATHRAPRALLRSRRPAEPPTVPRTACPGLPGGGATAAPLPRRPPHHGRIQRAPPSSHFLQLLLHQSSAGRRDRAAAQPRGPPPRCPPPGRAPRPRAGGAGGGRAPPQGSP